MSPSSAITSRSTSFDPAPAGTRVRVLTILSFVIAALVPAVAAILTSMKPSSEDAAIAALAVSALVPAVFLVWWFSRIRAYDVSDDGFLRVSFPWRSVKIPLDGLESAHEDRAAFVGAWKTVGNDGLGSINGRFWSRRLGWFRAYVTDTGRAVVLRWPKRSVVVSPAQPSLFLAALRLLPGRARGK